MSELRVEFQTCSGECRPLPAKLVQAIEIAEAAVNLSGRQPREAHLAQPRQAPAQTPHAAARRRPETAQIVAEPGTEVGLIAHERVHIAQVLPPTGLESRERIAPLRARGREPDHPFAPTSLLQQDASARAARGVGFRCARDDVEVFRNERCGITPRYPDRLYRSRGQHTAAQNTAAIVGCDPDQLLAAVERQDLGRSRQRARETMPPQRQPVP